jgi:hypothetical protein
LWSFSLLSHAPASSIRLAIVTMNLSSILSRSSPRSYYALRVRMSSCLRSSLTADSSFLSGITTSSFNSSGLPTEFEEEKLPT